VYTDKPKKFSLGVRFFLHVPENPEIGDIVFSYAKGNTELFTHAGWLTLCALSDEMREVLEKPISEEDKKEKIKHIFGQMTTRNLDI